LTYVIFIRKKAELLGFIKKIITPEPSEINNRFFFTEFPKIWPIFSAISDIFFMFDNPTVENFIVLNGNYHF
jgi:hypothetical protein